MTRDLNKRVTKLEKGREASRANVPRSQPQGLEDWFRSKAREHAVAVAAIVLNGRPKEDEHLKRAWERALKHHKIDLAISTVKNLNDWRNYRRAFQIACQKMYPSVMGRGIETERFSEIFQNAPVWLLEFTSMRLDAHLLDFELPRMSAKRGWERLGSRNGSSGRCYHWGCGLIANRRLRTIGVLRPKKGSASSYC